MDTHTQVCVWSCPNISAPSGRPFRSKPSSNDGNKVYEDPRKENECKDQDKDTNNVNTVTLIVNAAGTNKDNELPFDLNMPALEDVSIFNFSSDDEDDGSVADMNNLDTTIQVSPIPTTRIHKDHPLDQKKDGIFISQDKYVAKILKKFGFTKVKTASTPMETQKPLLKDEDGKEVDVHIDCNEKKLIQMVKIHTDKNVADLLTKGFDFWSTALAKTINEEVQLHAKVDGKKIIVTVSSVRRDLRLVDEGGIDCLLNSTIFEQLALMGKPKRKNTKVPQPSGSTKSVADEAVHKKLRDRLVRGATTAFSLKAEQDSGGALRCQETRKDTTAQTRFESVSKHSNDTLLARGNTLQTDEDRLELNELMALCINLQTRVLDLEKTKTTQQNKIDSLKTRVESSRDKESLGEDASKHRRRIDAIDQDEDLTLVNVQDDAGMFDVNDLGDEEVKEIVIHEQEEPCKLATTIATIPKQQSQDKGKGIIIEEPVKSKKKDQIRLDEKDAKRLQAKINEEERLARERELKRNKKPILP
nr:retrovirus-related Pol polyprotein from transposon TNT 1-94 [Tanacetum cinerariifolium]